MSETTNISNYKKNSLQVIALLFFAIALAIVLRVFFFSTFKIPSPSMEPALYTGDYIIVNKLVPGARIFKNYKFIEKNTRPEYWRTKGVGEIKRNDVLVFNFPYTDWNKLKLDVDVYYIKRCVAIPGDTFYIDNGIYKVKGCNNTLGNMNGQQDISRLTALNIGSETYNCFPFNENFNWTMKQFGPLYVPRRGDKISIDTLNICLYKKLIEYETAMKVNVTSNMVYLQDSSINGYTFKTNYYFMAGDLVRDSRDSRYWGLLPEDHIVGKAAIIWKSEDPYTGKIRWDRVMKFIE